MAVVAALGVCVSVVAATLLPALRWWLDASALALAVGLTVWAVVGTVQLVFLTIFHGVERADLHESIEESAALLKQRQTRRPA